MVRQVTQRIDRLRKAAGQLTARPVLFAIAVIAAATFEASMAHAQTATKKEAAQKADVSRTQALSRRVEQLEEQIVDLQVVIGTLESLAKVGGRSAGPAFTSGRASSSDGVRVGGLETQVKALSAQVAQLSQQVRALQQSGAGKPIADPLNPTGPVQPRGTSVGSSFGATTINPTQGSDAVGDLIRAQPLPPPAGSAAPPVAGGSGSAPKSAYEAAYNQLLQQDYTAAQAGFRGFLRNHPDHSLVPNALYWLGETYYVQQNYSDAAEAFDIVIAAYGNSNKAPDSQLKRGMALANLGKRSEACSVFRALAKRYPNAPHHVKSKANSERQRVGCT